MKDCNKMLIDLLDEKIRRLEHEKDEQRREINRLKKEIKELKKGVNSDEK